MRRKWILFAGACGSVVVACGLVFIFNLEEILYNPSVPTGFLQIARVLLVGVGMISMPTIWHARDRIGSAWLLVLVCNWLVTAVGLLNVLHSANPFALHLPTTPITNLVAVWALVGLTFGFWMSLSDHRYAPREKPYGE